MFIVEFFLLTEQSVGKACSNADLVNRKTFRIKQNDPGKILDILFNSGFTVMGMFFNLGELVTGMV